MLLDPLEDLAAITGASRPDDLWRWLVATRTLRAESDTFVAEITFTKLHRENRSEAWRTAGLLCTDPRWRRVTGKLIRAIEASGLVTDEQLDALAHDFAMGDRYGWPVPEAWLRDGTVRVDSLPRRGGTRARRVVVERSIEPPLRRWGAARAVRRDASAVTAVLDRAAQVPARAGDYLLLGLLDACDALDDKTGATLIDLGVGWTSGTVRLGALEQVAARDGWEAAVRIAATDPSEKVRQWAAKKGRTKQGRTAQRRTSSGAPGPGGEGAGGDESPTQASLFDP